MGFRGRLEITDGTTFIDLLGNSGGTKSIFGLLEWEPAAPDIKEGGIWMNNPLLDGRQLAIRKEGNIIETFSLVAKGQNATDILNAITRLRYMLNRAVGYWTNRARYPDPIYLLIQYPEETEPFWALIYDYRLPQLTNPYVQPMYGKKQAVIPEFTLVIERGLRSSVTGLECADLNFEKVWIVLNSGTFSPSAGEDDCEVNLTASSINLTGTTAFFGTALFVPTRYGIGVRFINVTIPAGAIIQRAYLIIDSAITMTGNQPILLIDGELNAAPAIFSTFADYDARVRTANKVHVTKNDYQSNCVSGSPYNIPANPIPQGLEEVVQEIIDLGAWASGNDLVLFIEPDTGNVNFDYRWAGMVEHAGFDPIGLYVEWSDPATSKTSSIVDDDCAPVFLTNQMKFGQIDTVQRYNATSANYTVLNGTAMPWELISEVAVNSAVYFACDLNTDFAQFYSIVLNLVEAFTSEITIVWETFAGMGWAAATDLVDGSNGLKNLGKSVVHWTPASGQMVETTINGIQATYIRARITNIGAGSATVPTHIGADEVLTPGYPYIDITNIPFGDIRLPFQIMASPVGSGTSVVNYTLDELWIAVCDLDKKRDFVPFINLLEAESYQKPTGVTVDAIAPYADATIYDAAARYAIAFIEAGVQAETDILRVDFDNAATPNYYGKFRVFLRRKANLDPENASYRLRLTTDVAGGATPIQYQTDLIPDTDNPGYSIIDFGTLTIPQSLESFHLIISGETSAASQTYLVDLILLPVDEMFIHAYQRLGADVTAWEQVYDDTSIVIDSTGDELKAWIQRAGLVASTLMVEANGDVTLDPLKDYRLWFFAGTYTSSCTNYQRQYWPGLDTAITMKFLTKKI